MGRAVLLRHDLPDGSFHYDWLIEPASGEMVFRHGVAQVGPEMRAVGERRRVRTPVSHERRHRDMPLAQH